MSRGLWEAIGSRVGLKGLKIDLSIMPNGGVYLVSWHEEKFLTGLKKQIHWLFNIRKAFVDLTESSEELSRNYNKLEESKKLLQKQTTRLTIAYNITKSIWKSYDIYKTLNMITGALVNDTGLSCARLKIYKDTEGNIFEIEAANGILEINARPILNPIIIENEKIGELSIYPQDDSNISELDELMEYLLPIINISIHDSLVLRTITDYKNNLEFKVDERTTELKSAQEKLSEIIQLQNRFFTNISHEFRTPLTLILGPSKQILEQAQDEKIKRNADLIFNNANKLNRLANQLLDISKIEAGKMKLDVSRQNIIPVIKRIFHSFKSFAEKKNISLTFNANSEEVTMYFDEDKVDKIISNLLSNALKFTPEGGCVNVETTIKSANDGTQNKEFIEIKISDNGIGISEDNLGKIFDRFYQVDNNLSKAYEGTGVGLSLTKELVEIHKGSIDVKSEEGKGSSFGVLLPLGKAHLLDTEIIKIIQKKPAHISGNELSPHYYNEDLSVKNENNIPKSNKSSDKPLLLIIEDNSDVRKYIIEVLQDRYLTAEAFDGEDGLEKAFDLIPDLIISDIMMPGIEGTKLCHLLKNDSRISDIMMPKMDGTILCHTLKTDSRTSHIPVVLLTAKATLRDKIEGLETGADDYIMKPFESKELKARINNLLEQRNRIHKHFQKYEIVLDESSLTSIDQKFLKSVIEVINQNITDENFSVEILAENLTISRSLLHKKLTALIGESPGELIKRVRLNKAAKLLEHKSGNISEIALQVGFSNPSYFAECFYKQFGFKPSQYHNNTNKH